MSSQTLGPLARLTIVAAASASLAACGGGGGGGGGGVQPVTPAPTTPITPTTPPAPTTNPSLPLNPPVTTSGEYRRSYGLAAIHADVGYGLGATGKGVIVGVIDTGSDPTAADLQGAYSPDSTDIIASRNTPVGTDKHGAYVAGVIASRFNNTGTIGVAYESTILSIRADKTSTGDCTEDCDNFDDADIGRGVDYAISKGARIINLSLGGEGSSPTFTAAMARAVAAGVVIVASAGNDSKTDPNYPARYSVDSRFSGLVVAVGATDANGVMADFSNKAGVAREGYITAPGKDVITGCEANGDCWRVSGTSFAAPHVAGALAMLLQYFPALSGRDALAILIRTADDKGDAGTDGVYGRGAMNLTRAFQPVGASSLSTVGGAQIVLPESDVGQAVGGAFGDAISRSGALSTVIHDVYLRPFAVDLADGYRRVQRRDLVATAPAVREAGQAMALPLPGALGQARLSLSAASPMFPSTDPVDASPARAFLRPEDPASVLAVTELGGLSFSAWRGQGAVAAPSGLGGRNAFATLAAPDRTAAAAWRVGSWAFGAEGGWAERRTPLALSPVDASRYGAATAAFVGQHMRLSLTGGSLTEPRGAFGSELAPGSPLSLAARTRFAALGLDRPVAGLQLRAEASIGRTDGGGQLVDVDQAISASWRLAVAGTCRSGLLCQRFGLEIAQPLRVEAGTFQAILADAPTDAEDPITFSQRRFSASPSSREIDLRLNADRPFGLGVLRLEAAVAFNPGHRTGEAELGASAAWRTEF